MQQEHLLSRMRTSVKMLLLYLGLWWASAVCTPSFSQSIDTASVAQKLDAYRQDHLQEKLFLHIDKGLYVAGELIWFSIYAVDGAAHHLLPLSKVAYVEVMSDEDKPLLQAKIALEGGRGQGSFLVPQSIATGRYTLRAYTAWMKNFDADFYFHQPITIVNTLKRPDWQKLEKEVGYDFQLFPEGGNLVQGLESKIAFLLVDKNGKGQPATGVVVNASNDTIQHFKTLRFGMGTFLLTPVRGQHYKALVRLNDGTLLSKDLPAAFDQGQVLSIHTTSPDQITVTVTTNSTDGVYYLLAHCRQVVKASLSGKTSNGKLTFTLNKSQLGDGINHFTLFNQAQQPVCERLYFKSPENRLTILTNLQQTRFKTREKVSIALHTQDSQQRPLAASLSLSVHLEEEQPAEPPNSIESYLLLSSDLKGGVEDPTYYFTHTDSEAAEAMDHLMLTKGWSRFTWETLLQPSATALTYLPEYEGPIVSATITDKITGLPQSQLPAYLTAPGSKAHISYAVSNPEGKYQFVTPTLQGTNEVILQLAHQTAEHYDIRIDDPFSSTRSVIKTAAIDLPQQLENQLLTLNVSTQVENHYSPTHYQQFAKPHTADSSAFFGRPDKTYYLDAYTRFTTLEEVLREYVTEVRVRKQADGFHFSVRNTPYQIFFTEAPLVLLDGVPVFDVNKIMAVDPLQIRKIEVVARKYFFGPLLFNGIVSYSSYSGAPATIEPDPHSLLLTYEGLQLERAFYQPVYETQAQQTSRQPDFRNQLHWAPTIQMDSTGQQTVSFYTSDLTGTYIITIQGLSADGTPGSKEVKIEVGR